MVHVTGDKNTSVTGAVQKSGAERTKQTEKSDPINAVHYKATEDRELFLSQHKNDEIF